MKYKVIKWITVVLQLGLLGALFLPFVHDYELSASLWSVITNGYRNGALEVIFTYALYYIPVVVGILLVLLLESRLRYGISLLAATMGLTLTLSRTLFPAIAAGWYTFAVYQMGLYVLLGLECAVILFSLIGICCKEPPLPAYLQPVDPKTDTAEIVLPSTDERSTAQKSKRGAKHMAK